jgi:uroporphyrinogen-III synthase
LSKPEQIIITRTLPGAEKTALRAKSLGLEPIILPAAKVIAKDFKVDIEGLQALLVTSSNAPQLANINDNLLSIPIYAVGDATMDACINRGFTQVISAGGDANALAVLIADRLKPEDGKLMHLRGDDVAGDVGGLLRACGFELINAVCYTTIINPEFNEKINPLLTENSGFIMFHSPKGSERFAAALLNTSLDNWCAICISEAASQALNGLGFKEIRVAARPNEDAMFDIIKP